MSERVRLAGDCVTFLCPGCGDHHAVPVPPHPRAWGWNGNMDKPTFTPSLLVRSGHHAPSWTPGDSCWCGKGYRYTCYVCHSFITDGRIQFLTDCTHALAGQTVDLTTIDQGEP